MAARPAFPLLRPEGDEPRSVSRVVNRALGGGLNVTGEVDLPEAGGEVVVEDSRVHELSCVLFMQAWWVVGAQAEVGQLRLTVAAGAGPRVLVYAVLG